MKINQFFKIISIVSIVFVYLFGCEKQLNSQILYNGVGHIHPDCQENWTAAGLLYQISEAVNVFNVASESGTDNDKVSSAVTKAKNASASGQISIVYFPEGTYELTYYIQLGPADSNIVFQGDGSDKTFLIFNQIYGDPNFNCFEISGSSGEHTNLTQDIAKGSTSIQGDLSEVVAGDWIHFTEYYFDYHPHPGDELEPKIVGQITRLLTKNGDTGTIKDEATRDYSVSPYILKLAKITPIRNVGIENLTIQRLTSNKATEDGKGENIKFAYALNCWVKGVESYNPARNHLVVDHSTHMEISGCNFHHAADYGSGGYGYGVCLYGSMTNSLVENNIFSHLRHAMVAGGGANCNVWAFNYSRDQYSGTWADADLDLHAKYPYGNLFEENVVEYIVAQDYHGLNGPYNAFVRNRISPEHVEIKNMELWSTLGNVKSDTQPPYHLYAATHEYETPAIYDIFGFEGTYGVIPIIHNQRAGYPFDGQNCELRDLSYFYSDRPDFLSMSYSWPSIGPKYYGTTCSQRIPAQDRWNETVKTYLPDPIELRPCGVLQSNRTWGGVVSLYCDVVIPSGVVLFLSDGALVNLSGCYLKSTGGVIVIEGEAVFNPDIKLMDGSTLLGQYPNSQSAFADGGGSNEVHIYSDETWNSNKTIPIDAKVKGGSTLSISNCSVLFNSGTNLIIEGNLEINGTPGQHVIIDGQNYTRYGYSNAMIKIAAGGTATIQYADFKNAGYELFVDQNAGAVTIEHCTFTNFGKDNNSIALAVSNPSGQISISNNSFTGAGSKGKGVYAINTGTNITINENTFTSCRIGVHCYSADAFITSNVIQNSYSYGIQSSNVTNAADYRDNNISGTFYGVYLSSSSPFLMFNCIHESKVLINSSSPSFATRWFEELGDKGHNTITNASSPLIYVQNYSNPFMGYYGGEWEDGGYNSIFETDLPHIYVTNHSHVMADNNYWGMEGPANAADGTSSISNENPLYSNPNPSIQSSPDNKNVIAKIAYSQDDKDDEQEFLAAVDLGYNSEYVASKDDLKKLIDKKTDSKYPVLAILMYDFFTKREVKDTKSSRDEAVVKDELDDLLDELESKAKEDRLRPFGLKLKAREAVLNRDYKTFSEYNNQMIKGYPNSVPEMTSLYDEMAYQINVLGNLEKAKELLSRMDSAYPEDELTLHAHILMGEDVDFSKQEAPRKELTSIAEEIPTEFRLYPAVPNPFPARGRSAYGGNPTTLISYDLPQDAHVRLTVYDGLGRQVITLVDGSKTKGRHDALLDGKNLASGIYFIHFKADQFIQTAKVC